MQRDHHQRAQYLHSGEQDEPEIAAAQHGGAEEIAERNVAERVRRGRDGEQHTDQDRSSDEHSPRAWGARRRPAACADALQEPERDDRARQHFREEEEARNERQRGGDGARLVHEEEGDQRIEHRQQDGAQ